MSPDNNTARIFYSDLTLEVNPSMDNFETPLKSNLATRYDVLNLGLSKRKITTFKLTSIVNDIGWLLSDIQEESFYSIDTIPHCPPKTHE